jgi:hypothetical protein
VKPFSTMSVLQHPLEAVWYEIRDHLPELVPQLADIRAVVPLERSADGAITHIVNRWEADPKIPASLASALKIDVIHWIDRAEWNDLTHECHWRIEPGFFADRIRCSGKTMYESAIGGRGTRITFRGELQVTIGSMMGGALASAVESFVTAVIPKNFQALANAAGSTLARRSALTR